MKTDVLREIVVELPVAECGCINGKVPGKKEKHIHAVVAALLSGDKRINDLCLQLKLIVTGKFDGYVFHDFKS